jgi:hypothetical protein
VQLVHHPLQPSEDVAVAPAELRQGGLETGGNVPLDPDDLVEEAVEEDCVAGLIDLLGREEVLLLLLGSSFDVGGEAVGDRILAVEEHRVDPHGGLPLNLRERLPALLVLGEVELGRLPVPLLPAAVEVVVRDLTGDVLLRDRHRCLRPLVLLPLGLPV